MNQDTLDDNPQIKEVLKALNHAKRRDILVYLKDLERGTGFSELMEYLEIDSKTSSQFSYHLKLLQTAKLIEKKDEKYIISPLGIKACSMLDLVDTTEKNDSIVQRISNSYKNITPLDQILLSFDIFSFLLILMPLQGMFEHTSTIPLLFLPMVIGLFLFGFLIFYSYLKLKYIPSILILSSVIWIIFLPSHQLKTGLIYLGSVFSLIFLVQALINFVIGKNNFLIYFISGIIFLIITVLTTMYIIYFEYLKQEQLV